MSSPLPFTMDHALQMVTRKVFCILQSKAREIFGMLFPRVFQGGLSNKGFLCGIAPLVPCESFHCSRAGRGRLAGMGGRDFLCSFAPLSSSAPLHLPSSCLLYLSKPTEGFTQVCGGGEARPVVKDLERRRERIRKSKLLP